MDIIMIKMTKVSSYFYLDKVLSMYATIVVIVKDPESGLHVLPGVDVVLLLGHHLQELVELKGVVDIVLRHLPHSRKQLLLWKVYCHTPKKRKNLNLFWSGCSPVGLCPRDFITTWTSKFSAIKV